MWAVATITIATLWLLPAATSYPNQDRIWRRFGQILHRGLGLDMLTVKLGIGFHSAC